MSDNIKRKNIYKWVILGGLLPLCVICLIFGCSATLNQDYKETGTNSSTQKDTQATMQVSTEATTEITTEVTTEITTEITTEAPTPAPTPAIPAPTPMPYTPGDGTGRKVYLTFDDGSSGNTDIILDVLKKYNVKATFFVVMPKINQEAAIARYKRIIDEGHTLGIHSSSHDYVQIYKTMEAYVDDVTRMRDFIYNNTGYMPTFYRFPGGSSNSYIGKIGSLTLDQAKQWLAQNNLSYFDWNVSSNDALDATVAESVIFDGIFNSGGVSVYAQPTSVVLMHDSDYKTTTASTIERTVSRLLAEHFELLPITNDTYPIRHR